MNGNYYFCQLCINSPAYSSFDSLYTHINFLHGTDPSFKVRCELNPECGSIYRTFPSYKSHVYKKHRELISKSADKKDIICSIDDDSNNSSQFSYADDGTSEREINDNENDENFQSTTEYDDAMDVDEAMDVDYPIFTRTILENDEESFDMRKFQKYYTRFLLELREQHLLSQNIILSITSNFSLLFNVVLKIIKNIERDPDATVATVV
ncbi:unnamed protein product, partial [Adineta steineri]